MGWHRRCCNIDVLPVQCQFCFVKHHLTTMIKNYFKTAWRNLKHNKIYAAINIFGMAVGLAAFLMIALYVSDELIYDR